ncbi:hypothetical protein V1514DRAFT_322872 [Lipomyces japonicus]|uniref:uncharacterized protein n=1 Tax=Lipomyces japonicus TaxID=56871 RepID=UPI0034CEE498
MTTLEEAIRLALDAESLCYNADKGLPRRITRPPVIRPFPMVTPRPPMRRPLSPDGMQVDAMRDRGNSDLPTAPK